MLVGALGVLEPVEVLQGDAVLEDEGGELAWEGDVLVALHDHDVAGRGVRVLPHPLPLQVDLVGAASVKEMGWKDGSKAVEMFLREIDWLIGSELFRWKNLCYIFFFVGQVRPSYTCWVY